MQHARQALLDKALDALYRFRGQVMPLNDLVKQPGVVGKSTWVRYFTSRRVHLAYEPLAAPNTTYCLDYEDADGHHMIDIPKIVYDSLALPATVHDDEDERRRWEVSRRSQRDTPSFWR